MYNQEQCIQLFFLPSVDAFKNNEKTGMQRNWLGLAALNIEMDGQSSRPTLVSLKHNSLSLSRALMQHFVKPLAAAVPTWLYKHLELQFSCSESINSSL